MCERDRGHKVVQAVEDSYFEGELNEILSFEGSMCTGHGYDLCLSTEKVVNTISTAAE